MFNTKYYVNEEKRTVVCKIVDAFDGVVDDLARRGFAPGNEDAFFAATCSDEFVGKARCVPEDTFDVEKGKRIAYKKAVMKYFSAKKKVVERIRENQEGYFYTFMEATNKMLQAYDRTLEKAAKDCKDIISGAI